VPPQVIPGLLIALAAARQTIITVPSDALRPKGQGFVLHGSQVAPRAGRGDFSAWREGSLNAPTRTFEAVG